MSVVDMAQTHDKKVDQLANYYEAQGYKVVIEPSQGELPDFLRGFHPDLIAIKPDGNIVVEVSSTNKVRRVDYWRELAEMVNRQAGWSFELVLPPSSEPQAESLSEPEIREILKSSRTLASEGATEAGFLFVWSAVEAALRLLMERYNVETPDTRPGTLIGRLYGDGLMEREDYASLTNYLLYRNSLVHGFRQSVTEEDIAQLQAIVERLLSE
jgi:hypothetical protein